MLFRKTAEVFSIISVALFASLFALPTRAQGQQTGCNPQQQKTINLSAIDKAGLTVKDLRAADLTLKIGNQPVNITDFSSHIDEPFDVALLIDISLSQEQALPQVRAAAKAFVDAVRAGAQNRLALVSFSNEVKDEELLTKDSAAIYLALAQLKIDTPPGYIGNGVVVSSSPRRNKSIPGSTSLWDTTRKSIGRIFDAASKGRQRAVLLFTDGADTSSSGKLKAVVEESLKQGVAFYVIGTATSYVDVERDPLSKLANETGGVAIFPEKKKDYGPALTEVFRRLSTQYRIGYCGAFGDHERIEIKVVNPDIKKRSPELAYRRY